MSKWQSEGKSLHTCTRLSPVSNQVVQDKGVGHNIIKEPVDEANPSSITHFHNRD